MKGTITSNNITGQCRSLVLPPEKDVLSWAILIGLFIPINLAANTALIVALKKTEQIKSISNTFIAIMGFSDLFSGMLSLPLLEAYMLTSFKYQCGIAKLVESVIFFSYSFSSFVLMGISVDRYMHVVKPQLYRTVQTRYTMGIWSVSSFFASIGITCVISMHSSLALQAFFLLSTFFFIGCLTALYNKVIGVLTRNQIITVSWKAEDGSVLSASRERLAKQRTNLFKLSATKTVRLVLLAACLSYIPFNVTSCVLAYFDYKVQEISSFNFYILHQLALVLLLSTSFTSSCIIIYGNSKCRRFLCKCSRNKTSDKPKTGL